LSKSSNQTPLARQYGAIKAKYPGALLLFRVGDFYETFGEDAKGVMAPNPKQLWLAFRTIL
jgi:DNA mismatch repair ATPase MutS